MSDSILVRITLDRFDLASTVKQTQVRVDIPEVARVGWLLPEVMYGALVPLPWEEALREVFAFTDGRAVPEWDAQLVAARQRVREWLAVDENHDAMHDAWFAAEARRHPVSRSLLADVERLRARVAELEADREAARPADKLTRLLAPTQALQPDLGPLPPEDADTITSLAPSLDSGVKYNSATHTLQLDLEATREQWLVWERALKVDLERTTHRGGFVTSHAQWRGTHVVIRCFFAEPDAAPPAVTIYRAQWGDSMPLGLYLADDDARAHCEAHARREMPGAVLSWVVDEDDVIARLLATLDGEQGPTGYTVTALEVAAEYDAEADE